VIAMPKLEDIMPYFTPQTAMLVIAVLALLVVTLALVTLAVGRDEG
jgi:hypothetical protein